MKEWHESPKTLQIKQQERFAMHFEHILSCFLLPVFFTPPICACTQHQTLRTIFTLVHTFSRTPSSSSSSSSVGPGQVFGLLRAWGRTTYLSVRHSWWIRLSWTPCAPGSSQPLLTLEINPAVSQGIIHPGQLKAGLFFHSPPVPVATPSWISF